MSFSLQLNVRRWIGGNFMHIGIRIRKLREAVGLSQKEASTGIISASHYSNIESGRFEPSKDVLELLADRFNVPAPYLYKHHTHDSELQSVLMKYEHLLRENMEDLPRFKAKHATKFTYIPSLSQEAIYNLLQYAELVKAGQITEAQKHYSTEIAHIPRNSIKTLGTPLNGISTYILGLYDYFNKQYLQSIEQFKDALEMIKDDYTRAKIYYNISLALYHLYDYAEALQYAYKAQHGYLELHDWTATGDCYNLIAALYLEQQKYAEAFPHIKKGLSVLGGQINETTARLYHNLAIVQWHEKNYYDALKTINQSIEMKQRLNSSNLFISYKMKLTILNSMEDFMAVGEIIRLIRRMPLSERECMQLNYFEAKMFHAVHEFQRYEQSMLLCIRYFYSHEEWKELKDASRHMALYYANRKRYKLAHECQTLCIVAYERLTRERR